MPRNIIRFRLTGVLAAMIALGIPVATPHAASAAVPVVLGTAADFAILAGSTVTNTDFTIVTGDLGLSPGTAVTGFPPGTVVGAIHTADADAAQAQADLTIAYNDAAGQAPDATIPTELGGTTLTPGVYNSTSGTFGITGNLTLNAQGNPNAIFIFQADSTLITASDSTVTLIGGAQACNVFWQVGSSATLGTNSSLAGNVLALASITVATGANVNGRILARNGAVTLDTNTIARSVCQVGPIRSTTTTLNSSCAIRQESPITFIATVRSSGLIAPTGPVEFFADGVSLGTAQLDATGHATLTVANLSEGVRQIVATFPGTADLDPSTSPVFIQSVDSNGFCLIKGCWSETCPVPESRFFSTRRNV
ncbi:ice-binding family protein [Streptosporangium saharense]|uniref:ice-binding family protein n=1 Tax=Streptosporangium saharense TaxID=1706840 RepID=UPI0033301C65